MWWVAYSVCIKSSALETCWKRTRGRDPAARKSSHLGLRQGVPETGRTMIKEELKRSMSSEG